MAVAVAVAMRVDRDDDLNDMRRFVSTFIGCSDPSWLSSNGSVCSWVGVTCSTPQESATLSSPPRVQEFRWNFKDCRGTLNLTALPSAIKYLYLNSNNFTGPIDLTTLPPTIEQLYLNNNQLSGTKYGRLCLA